MQLQLAQTATGHGSTVVLQTVDWDLTAMELVYVASESVIILSFSVLVLLTLVGSWALSTCYVANRWVGYMMGALLLIFVFDRALLLMLGNWEASSGLTYWKAFLAVLCVGAVSLVAWWFSVNALRPINTQATGTSITEFESEVDYLHSRLIKATQTGNVCRVACDLNKGGNCPVVSPTTFKEAADICMKHQVHVSNEAATTFEEIKKLARSVRQKFEEPTLEADQAIVLENKSKPGPN